MWLNPTLRERVSLFVRDKIGMLIMIVVGHRNGILVVNLRADRSLQTEVKLVTSARRKDTLNLSAISYKIRLKGRLRIKRENNHKIPVKMML